MTARREHGSTGLPAVSAYDAEIRLTKAFADLATYVVTAIAAASAGPSAVAQLGPAPEFSYLLTQKQFDDINRICTSEHWPLINCSGILIDVRTFTHPMDSRQQKDNCSAADACNIVAKAYSPHSVIRINRRHDQQAIVLNARQKIRINGDAFYALAIVALAQDGNRCFLTPVTAYHADDGKARAIERNLR